MNEHRRFVLIKQEFESLRRLCDPKSVSEWRPTEEQKSVYAQLLENILSHIDAIEGAHNRVVFRDGRVQDYVPASSLAFYRDEVEPQIDNLKEAYAIIDANQACVYELLKGLDAYLTEIDRVSATFKVAVDRMYDLLENEPDMHASFSPDAAYAVIDSKLIRFEPDAWLERAQALKPIRTIRKKVLLPREVHFRLQEIFRAYIFGCWLSVLALSRSLLEYSLIETLDSVESRRSTRHKNTGERKLAFLIDEAAHYAPALVESMKVLKTYGDSYLHPKPQKQGNVVSIKKPLSEMENDAHDAITRVVAVIEELYFTFNESK